VEIVNLKTNYHQVLHHTVSVLNHGGLVVFPSDSVYGLAVDPRRQPAVDRLLAFKSRWPGKAVSVAVSGITMARRYACLTSTVKNIFRHLLPGPFTVICPGRHCLAKGIEAENGTIGLRWPHYQFITDLVGKLDYPITATSANLSGRTPHYSIAAFLNTLSTRKKNLLDLLVDAGRLPRHQPSTVIDATESTIKILRRGDLITADSQTLISQSVKETRRIAAFLFDKVKNIADRPVVFALAGELGSGKTVFASGIGRALGITSSITSPTFVIFNEFRLSNPAFQISSFLHFDLYRLQNKADFDHIDFIKHFQPHTLSCIEWPENMGSILLNRLRRLSYFIAVGFDYRSATTRQIKFNLPPC
jgi:L-threonylcarbamoyladenylate synthase